MQLNINTPESVDEITALRGIFEDYLKGVYWTEHVLSALFSDILVNINSQNVAKMISEHASNTRLHSKRIERIFESIGIRPEERKSVAIESLISELDIAIQQIKFGLVRDAAIIAIIQHIIHFEIASYGTLKSFALTLKEEEIVTLIDESLMEEKALDLKLSAIAEAYINDEAANREV